MTSFDWFDGSGRYSVARHWTPRGVPGQADTAVVTGGDVVLSSQDVQAMVIIGTANAGSQPTLDLRNSSLSLLTMPENLPKFPYTVETPRDYATVNVWGQSSIGAINVGDIANTVRAPDPYGHGPIGAPNTLTVNLNGHTALGPGATLSTGFDVKYGSTLAVYGTSRSSLNASNSIIEGGRVVIDAPLGGHGTIYVTNGPLDYTGNTFTGSLELGGYVGSGDTIDIRMGHLQIDNPAAFMGWIDLLADEDIAGQPHAMGPQSVTLEGIAATSYGFDDSSHTMTLFSGDNVLAAVHFTPDIVAASFTPARFGNSYAPGIGVTQTADGVFLRGLFANPVDGATVIPLHA